jgi:hypothetical protein
MDEIGTEIRRVLESLAKCNEMLVGLAQKLRQTAGTVDVRRGFELRAYQSGVLLEGYVEAELESSKVLCGWIESSWNEQSWLVETSVLLNDETGQRTYHKFEDRTPSTVDDLVQQLQDAVSDLISFFARIDLSSV